MIVLTLPYPVSANRYWRPVRIGKHITIVPTKEAKEYRADVARLCAAKGLQPIAGRIAIAVRLFPSRPKDFAARQRKLGPTWDDGVQSIDLDNANKVLLDALKGIAFDDDKWVRRLTSERMEPDEHGARVIVAITQLAVPVVQGELLQRDPAQPARTSIDALGRDTQHAAELPSSRPLAAPAVPPSWQALLIP